MIPPVIVVGGGLAGIAAAFRLAEAGLDTCVLEAGPRLGGLATSQTDAVLGGERDDHPHPILASHVATLELLDRIDGLGQLTWPDGLAVRGPGAREGTLRSAMGPAPWHFTRAVGRLAALDGDARRAIPRGLWRMIREGDRARFEARDRTLADWLDARGAWSGDVTRRAWSALTLVLAGARPERLDAATGIQAFRDGLLATRASFTVAVAESPLSDLYDRAAVALEKAGVRVRLDQRVHGIAFDGTRVTGVVTEHEKLDAAAVVAAVHPGTLAGLVGSTLAKADRRLHDLDAWEAAPWVCGHYYFPTVVLDAPCALALGEHVHWLHDRGRGDDGGQHVLAVAGDVPDLAHADEATLQQRMLEEITTLLPAAKGLDPLEARTVVHRHAALAITPERAGRRPGAAPDPIGGPGVRNLMMAGAHCDSGWAPGMESAVRSGLDAAEAWIATHEGVRAPAPILGLDAPAGPFVRWFTKG